MKLKILLSLFITTLICGCNREKDALKLESSMEFPQLSSKPPLVRASYEVETMSQRTYGDDVIDNNNIVKGTDAPTVSRNKLYYEIYEDFSVGYAIEELKPTIEGYHNAITIKDVPRAKLIKVYDGHIDAFDDNNKLINTQATDEIYFEEAASIDSKMPLAEYFAEKIYNPKGVSKTSIQIVKQQATNISHHDGLISMRINTDEFGDDRLRTANDETEVSYNELEFNEEYGILIKETGYNSANEIVDQLSYYYKFNEDSSLSVTAERYSTKVYVEALDVTYLSITDYFYDNFQMETF